MREYTWVHFNSVIKTINNPQTELLNDVLFTAASEEAIMVVPRSIPHLSVQRPLLNCFCCCLVAQLYLTLCDTVDCSPPGSSGQRISQARILDWVAISFSRGTCQPRDRTYVSCTDRQADSLLLNHQGSPSLYI